MGRALVTRADIGTLHVPALLEQGYQVRANKLTDAGEMAAVMIQEAAR